MATYVDECRSACVINIYTCPVSPFVLFIHTRGRCRHVVDIDVSMRVRMHNYPTIYTIHIHLPIYIIHIYITHRRPGGNFQATVTLPF